MAQTTPHQDTKPRKKPTRRLWQLLMLLELSWRWEKQSDTTSKKKRQSTQSETQSTTHKTHIDAGTERFTLRSTHRKWCRNDTTHQSRRNNLTSCLHKKTLRPDFFTDTQTNKQTHHGGENSSRQIVTPTFTRTTCLPSPPCNPLIMMKSWSKRSLPQTSHSHDKQ